MVKAGPLMVLALGVLLLVSGPSAFSEPVPGWAYENSLTPSLEGELKRRECIRRRPIVTSEFSVQVYTIANLGGGLLPLADYAVILTSANGRESSAKTDAKGFVRLPGLPPGNYQLHIPYVMEPLSQEVRVTGSRSGPSLTIAAIANMTCGMVCTVASTRGPLATPPRCLFNR